LFTAAAMANLYP